MRSSKGEFRDYGNVINDLGGKWKDFSTVQKSDIAKSFAGTRQRENFLVLMDNLDQVDSLNKKVADSAGSAKEKFETTYSGSIDARINDVKQSLQELYRTLISSDAIKGFAINLNSAIRGFSTLTQLSTPLKIALTGLVIVMGLMVFNFKALLVELMTAPVGLTATSVASVLLTGSTLGLSTAVSTLGMALKALLLNPAVWAVLSVVAVLGVATYAIANHAKEQAKFKARVDENKASVEGLTDALKKMDSEGVKTASKPLEEKQDALQKQLAKKKKLIEEMDALRSKGVDTMSVNGSTQNFNKDQRALQGLEGQYADITKSIDGMNKELKESGIEVDEVTGKFKILTDAQKKMVIPNATKSYEETKVALGEIETSLAKVNALQEITPDLASELSAKYPELVGRVSNLADVQEFLNNKTKEQVDIQKENYLIMMGDDASFYDSKFKNNQEYEDFINDTFGRIVSGGNKANNIDLSNYKTMNELKEGVMNKFGGGIETWLSQYIDISAGGYNIDLSNFSTIAEAKLAITSKLNEEIKKVNRNMSVNTFFAEANRNLGANPLTGERDTSLIMGGAIKNAQELEQKNLQLDLKRKMLNNALETVDDNLGNFGAGMKGYTPVSGGISTNPNAGGGNYTPTGGDDAKKDKEAKDKEAKKDVENTEQLSDRYSILNNIIKRITNSIEDLNKAKENATDEEKLVLIEKEILLLKEQTQAQKNLLTEQLKYKAEAQAMLRGEGFSIDSNGLIANEKERLDAWVSYANAQTGTSKEVTIEHVKSIAKIVQEYNESNFNTIPKSLQNIAELKNAEINARKSIAEIIKKQISEEKDVMLRPLSSNWHSKQHIYAGNA